MVIGPIHFLDTFLETGVSPAKPEIIHTMGISGAHDLYLLSHTSVHLECNYYDKKVINHNRHELFL